MFFFIALLIHCKNCQVLDQPAKKQVVAKHAQETPAMKIMLWVAMQIFFHILHQLGKSYLNRNVGCVLNNYKVFTSDVLKMYAKILLFIRFVKNKVDNIKHEIKLFINFSLFWEDVLTLLQNSY